MCGIAGIVCLRAGCTEDHAPAVSGMCDALAHRGPDDADVFVGAGVSMGARRLAIQDLSPAGRMPMRDATGRCCIAYNGEIYNFADLRAELRERGYAFRSRSDTEVLLNAWIEWGVACFHRLVGMFAFAVHDAEEGSVTLVRDRFGIKPLYYRERQGHLQFASETKALPCLAEAGVDAHSLMEWSLYRNIDALTRDTMFRGIVSVLPGEAVRIQGGEIERRRVYSPIDGVDREEFERLGKAPTLEVISALGEQVEIAVRSRLVADVPVGTLLSGGLDSSLVTAIAARHHGRFTAFNVALPDHERLDESRHATHVARHLGVDLVTAPLTGEAFRRALPRVVFHSDMPITHPNSVAYDLITAVARERGVIVLLTGEGADELFGGYSWNYRRRRTLLRIASLLDTLPARLRGVLALVTYSMVGLPATSWRFRELLPQTVDLIDRYARRDWLERCTAAYDFVPGRFDRSVLGAMLADLYDFLAPLLRRLDRMSMANSVECRVPFLDHRLAHLATALPLSYRLGRRSDKWVLKRVAGRYVPDEILRRKKVGFPLPTAEFIAPLLSPRLFRDGFLVRDLGLQWPGVARQLERGSRGEDDAFGVLTLELWGRLFLRGETVAELEARLAELES